MKKVKIITLIILTCSVLSIVSLLLFSIPLVNRNIKSYRKIEFINIAKLISSIAINNYLKNEDYGKDTMLSCTNIIDLNDNYTNCGIYINNKIAYVTLNGTNIFKNMNIYGGTYLDSNLSNNKDDCIMNEYIATNALYEVNNYDSCISYTKDLFTQNRNYSLDNLKQFCKGNTVNGWTFTDNIEYMLNKGYTLKDLISNKVIKGSINNICIPNKVHKTCYSYNIINENNNNYIEITGYDDECGSNLVIPSKIDGLDVISIKDNAFNGKSITSVKFPKKIKYIGNNAFRGYGDDTLDIKGVRLEGVLDLSNMTNLEEIGAFAFADNQIKSIKFPKSITKIDEYAFSGNEIIGLLDLSNTKLTSISGYSFSSSKITSIKLPTTITSIGYTSFAGNKITGTLDLSNLNNLTSIDKEAFAYNKITSIILPLSIINIESESFSNNMIEGTLDFSNNINLNKIGDNAFTYNEIENIILPNSINTIEKGAFSKIENSNSNLLTVINASDNTFDWANIFDIDYDCTFITGVCNDIKITEK